MTDVTVLDPTRSAWDVAHDQQRFDRLGLTRRFGDKRHIRLDNALAQRAEN